MSTKIPKLRNNDAMPFFTRFLVEEEPPETPEPEPTPPPIWTFKWPSDWEDR
uniref:Microviridin/marinostatin family tricyclic proteinase inhibitor n=1 Tax=Nostoc sp. FSN-E TaxID=2027337 RepID=A0A2P1CZ81_9NOSO